MSLHEQCVGATDEWYTPAYVFEAMGLSWASEQLFDMDVSSPGRNVTPWIPALSFVTTRSLQMPWTGFVWCNAPFGARNGLAPWLDKFIAHGNGVALVPDRTSAPWWQAAAKRMDLILFVAPKIKFIGVDGASGQSPAQGTALMALGEQGCQALVNARDNDLGTLVRPSP